MTDIALDSFFTETLTDQNGNTCTDINLGLDKLFGMFNYYEQNTTEAQRFLVTEDEEGYPDLVALHSILKSQAYWWWILLFNKLEDPLTDIKANWLYSILSTAQVNSFTTTVDEQKIGESYNNSTTTDLISGKKINITSDSKSSIIGKTITLE